MSRRMLALAVLSILAVTGVAEANHKKPISKSFEATGLVPYAPPGGSMCEALPDPDVQVDRHIETFKAPEAGTFAAEITGFVGDYDMVLLDDKGSELARSDNAAGTSSGNPSTGDIVEKLKYKVKKAMNVHLHVCNFAGGPQVEGSYVFTYAR